MKQKRKTSLGCLFWIALILLVLVIFLFNRKRIETVLETTGFIDVISTSREEPEIERRGEEPESSREEPAPALETPEAETPEAPEETSPDELESSEPEEVIALEVVPENSSSSNSTENTNVEERRVRRAALYFVFHDGSKGELRRIVRPVYYVDSPLTDTLRALLEGPSGSELNQNLISLIPGDATIRSVIVKDGIAYIDMSEEFRFNAFGYEGSVLQLKQLIYTATEFATVSQVQFLIDGQKQQYLNPEGLYIGKPLSRESL